MLTAVTEGQFHYRAGTVFADTVGNKQPGDIVSTVWTAANNLTANHVPLDAAAVTALGTAGFVTNGVGQKVSLSVAQQNAGMRGAGAPTGRTSIDA